MKVIIEEGDVGGMAPGVYDVEITSTGMETNFWPAGTFFGNKEDLVTSRKMDLGLSINLDQTPAKRHWFNAAQFTSNAMPTHIDLQVGSKRVSLKVGDVIEEPGSYRGHWTIIGFPTAKTWRCTASLNGQEYTADLDFLAQDLADGKKIVRQHTTTPLSCDKSIADCTKHGNKKNFGGYNNPTTGRVAPCHHTFGGKACGVGWDAKADLYNETPYGCAAGVPPAMPEGYGEAPKEGCDECYGTGLYKGFGGPCSKGCPIKRT